MDNEKIQGLAPFSHVVLEGIVLLHNKTSLPFEGGGSLNPVLTQYLNDKGYLQTVNPAASEEPKIGLSSRGQEVYNALVQTIEQKIGPN